MRRLCSELGTLVVETYENHAAKMEHGAIDHVALDVRDIEEIFRYINEAGLNSTQIPFISCHSGKMV